MKNRQVAEKERSWLDCYFIPLVLSYHGAVAGDRSYKGNGAGVVMPLLRFFTSFQYKQLTFPFVTAL